MPGMTANQHDRLPSTFELYVSAELVALAANELGQSCTVEAMNRALFTLRVRLLSGSDVKGS